MTDWAEALRDQRQLADEMAREVPKVLADPGLDLSQAGRLYRALEEQAQFMETLSRRLEEGGYDLDLVAAAERVEAAFAELAAEAALRVKALREAPGGDGTPAGPG